MSQSLQEIIEALSENLLTVPCPHCRTLHPRYHLKFDEDIPGFEGWYWSMSSLLFFLQESEEAAASLHIRCVREDMNLFLAETHERLGIIVDWYGESCRGEQEKVKNG